MTTPTFRTERLIPVAEIFGPTIAGEGTDAGRRTYFLRLGGCDGLLSGHCSWCDSMHAVEPSQVRKLERLTQEQIIERFLALATDDSPCRTLTISGGNPALYDLQELIDELIGFEIWVETQGTIWRDWLGNVNVTVSPKPPSAGKFDSQRFEQFVTQLVTYPDRLKHNFLQQAVKIPVDPGFQDGADLVFAQEIFQEHIEGFGVFDFCLSVVTHPDDSVQDVIDRWRIVVDWAMDANLPDVRVLPQLHVLLWEHARGV